LANSIGPFAGQAVRRTGFFFFNEGEGNEPRRLLAFAVLGVSVLSLKNHTRYVFSKILLHPLGSKVFKKCRQVSAVVEDADNLNSPFGG
jgi:hypothetical protein